MVGVERREVVAVVAAERGVFLEQALLQVEAERGALVVGVAGLDVGQREAVDLAVAEQHVVERLAALLGRLRQQLRGPDLLDREALGELDQLPEVGARLAGRGDELVPELGAPLGVAVGALLLDPHRGRQDQVGGERGDGRVGVGDDDEVVRVAVARIALLVHVRAGLHVVVAPGPSRP